MDVLGYSQSLAFTIITECGKLYFTFKISEYTDKFLEVELLSQKVCTLVIWIALGKSRSSLVAQW